MAFQVLLPHGLKANPKECVFIVNHYSELVGLDVAWSPPQSFLVVEMAAPFSLSLFLSLSLSFGACFYVFVVSLLIMESICVSLFPNSYPEVLTAKMMLSGGRLWRGEVIRLR